jgi:AcrR family transcriptional regulator
MERRQRTWQAGPVTIRVTTGAEPPKERLSRDRIVETALAMMAERGYEAVSMRSLARELGTGPASLYAHVAHKDELDQLVVDRIARGVPVPEPDPARWQEQLKELARACLEGFRAHPGTARAAMGMIPTGEGTGRMVNAIMAICLAGGVPPQAAAWFCDLLAAYVCVVAYEESLWIARINSTPAGQPADHQQLDQQLADFFRQLPEDRFPMLVRYATQITAGDGEDRFGFGIDVLVAGLAAMAARQA